MVPVLHQLPILKNGYPVTEFAGREAVADLHSRFISDNFIKVRVNP